MKNIIMHYYNFKDILDIKKVNNIYYFYLNDDLYKFELIYNIEIIDIIYKTIDNDFYDQIVPNIYNRLYTIVDNNYYVLLKKKKYNSFDIYNNILNNNYIVPNNKLLNMSDWINLWSRKLDYYEYQQEHITNYSFILESFNYYLGMAENSISYIKNNINNNDYIPIVVSHRRIEEGNYYDPLNIVLDSKARDAAQYLKFIFWKNKYINFNMSDFIYKLGFNRNEYILLYSRLLYPCYYFDLYDEIINNNAKEKELLFIITRINEYETFLNSIYYHINKIISIPRITWI